MPRGGAGGLTFFAPNEDRIDSGLYSRQYLESQMAVALGGRVAEEIIFGEDEVNLEPSNFQHLEQLDPKLQSRRSRTSPPYLNLYTSTPQP